MKLKIIKKNKILQWWYNFHIGEEFEIVSVRYHSNGSNHDLVNVENIEQIKKYVEEYGEKLFFHCMTTDENGMYYEHQLNLEDTNYKTLERKLKLEKIIKKYDKSLYR